MRPFLLCALSFAAASALGEDNLRTSLKGDLNDANWSLGGLTSDQYGVLADGNGFLSVNGDSLIYGLFVEAGSWSLKYGADVTTTASGGLYVADGYLSLGGTAGKGRFATPAPIGVTAGHLSVASLNVEASRVQIGDDAGRIGDFTVGNGGFLKVGSGGLQIFRGKLNVSVGTVEAAGQTVKIDSGELKLDYYAEMSAQNLELGTTNLSITGGAQLNMNPLSNLRVSDTLWVRSGSTASPGSGGVLLVGDTPKDQGGIDPAKGAVTIGPNGTLKGSGTVSDLAVRGGTVEPGNSPGALNVGGSFSLGETSTLILEVGGLSDFDRVVVNGPATLDGTVRVLGYGGFAPDLSTQNYAFLTATSVVAGSHLGFVDDMGNAIAFYVRGGTVSFGAAPVPEPASMVVLGLGALGLLRRRARGV